MALPRSYEYKSVLSDNFTIQQFNILADGLAQGGGFTLVEDPADLELSYRFPLMRQEVLNANPDILTIQELNCAHLFGEILPDHTMILCPKLKSPACRFGALPDGLGMFVNRNMFDILDVNVFYYNAGTTGVNSGAIIACLVDKRNGTGLVVATTHLKSKVPFESKRVTQMSELLHKIQGMQFYLQGVLNMARLPQVILTGDFNSSPDLQVYQMVYDQNFESAYNSNSLLLPANKETAVGQERLPVTEYLKGEPTFTTMKFREKMIAHTIDYIWVSNITTTNQQSGLTNVFNTTTATTAGTTTSADEKDNKAVSTKNLMVQATWSMPSEEEVGPKGLPNKKYPSDHLSIAAIMGYQ